MLALGFALLLLVTGGFAGESDSGNGDGPGMKHCDVKNGETCYLTIVDQALEIDYENATSSCVDLGYEIARIPNLAVQTEIMKAIRQKMTKINRLNWVHAWIGATINSAGVVTPHITDWHWSPPFPMTKHRDFEWTNIYLEVYHDPAWTPQGLINTFPQYKTSGFVCQYVPRIAVECKDGFVYREKCYFANIYASFDIEFQHKESNCGAKGGKLGSILNQEHQTLAENYVRSENPDLKPYITVWLAMRYNYWTNDFTTPEGHSYPSTSLRWFPHYPQSDPSATTMILEVHTNPLDDPSAGIFNWFARPRSRTAGVFCERQIAPIVVKA